MDFPRPFDPARFLLIKAAPEVYWECLTCQMQDDGNGRTGLA
jgi:hypothetical protein